MDECLIKRHLTDKYCQNNFCHSNAILSHYTGTKLTQDEVTRVTHGTAAS